MRTMLLATTHLIAHGHNNDTGTTMTLPVGRIVWGHPAKPKPSTDQKGNPKIGKDGQQMMETSFGLAIPEAEFTATVWPAMHAEMSKGYPNGAPGTFSWKMTQPNEIDQNGKPYSAREGYAGHVVLAVSTTLEPPAMFRHDGTKWVQMQADEIKCGDYIQLEVNFKVNVPTDRTHTPSLYVNPRSIAFVGYGPAIVSSAFTSDPNAAFGSGPPPLPAGASATPIGAAPGQPGMPGTAQPPAAPGNSPPATMPGAPSASPVAPASPSPAPPAGPARPTDPAHIHDNGNGTEQWFVNGAWDGGAHPVGGAAQPPAPPPPPAPAAGGQLPPPATGFVANAAGMSGAPQMPGMPGAMPPR